MEDLLISGDMVITMGRETVVAVMGNRNGTNPLNAGTPTFVKERMKAGYRLPVMPVN